MEVRCASCNKLFRVSDDKITGSGIKFACTRCGAAVTITREDHEHYLRSQPTAAVMPVSVTPAVVQTPAPKIPHSGTVPADDHLDEFDMSDPATAAAAAAQQEPEQKKMPEKPLERPAVSAAPVQPQAKKEHPEPPASPKPAPPVQPKAEMKTPPVPKQEPVAIPKASPKPLSPAVAAKPEIKVPPKPKPEQVTVPSTPSEATGTRSATLPSGSFLSNKLIAVVIVAIIVLGGAGVAVKTFMRAPSEQANSAGMLSPEGLQVQNAAGSVDPVLKDLVVTGAVQNATDEQKTAWYILVEVYDANGSVIARGKYLNGKQLYSRRDLDILAKRGVNVQDLILKNMQEQGVLIPPRGSAPFEVRIIEPPVGMASFNANLQPYDPVQLFKEMKEEQK